MSDLEDFLEEARGETGKLVDSETVGRVTVELRKVGSQGVVRVLSGDKVLDEKTDGMGRAAAFFAGVIVGLETKG